MKSMSKKLSFWVAFCFLGCSVCGMSPSRGEPFGEKILRYFPQADVDKDGVLSEAEEAAVSQRAIQRFPEADLDGDGLLSKKEREQLLKKVVAARKRQDADSSAVRRFFGGRQSTPKPEPSLANVSYGEDERNVLDIWLAESEGPTPLAVYIHGGGFRSGSKEKLKANKLIDLLDAGISVAAINYRFVTTDPLPTAHHDAKRAIQFMRMKADEWKIDRDRVAAFGGSAGAQICMWLAYSDDMADPSSNDPVARESSRLMCVATTGGQTSNQPEFYAAHILPLLGREATVDALINPLGGESDPAKIQMKMWGGSTPEEASETARECSAIHLISSGDPPIFMSYGMPPDAKKPSNRTRVRGWLIHHVVFGTKLKEKADQLGVEADLSYPGADSRYPSEVAFFRDKLLAE